MQSRVGMGVIWDDMGMMGNHGTDLGYSGIVDESRWIHLLESQ